MRHVTRSAVPASLDGPDSPGAKELVRARAFFADENNRARSFAFKAYKGADVRAAMRTMFHRKCAYCEAFYAPTMPDDVEHYRPKAAIRDEGRVTKPGYWWLAMAWSNLLPSCADCNRARAQEIEGAGRRAVVGKANQFPLVAGSPRATEEGAEAKEVALLLDPTVDDPSPHLEFRDNGSVHPALMGEAESERGRTTIEVVALMRRDLVDARRIVARETQAAIRHVQETLDDIRFTEMQQGLLAHDKADRLAALRERLARDVDDMERKAAVETAYSSVADALVRAYKAMIGL